MNPTESIDRLFEEPFEPLWVRNERIATEQALQESITIGVDRQWRDAATASRLRISNRPDAPVAPPRRQWSMKWPFTTHVIRAK